MTVFADALDLRSAVGDQVNNRAISDRWPYLVQMAEHQFNQKIRTNWQESSATLIFTDGEATLPTDFLEMIDTYGSCNNLMHSGLRSDSKRYGMSFRTYSIADGKIYIRGFTGDRDILYYAKIPSIANNLAGSNWLLQQFPDVYLYGVSFQAAKYLRDTEQTPMMDTLYKDALKSLKIEDERVRWANGKIRMKDVIL